MSWLRFERTIRVIVDMHDLKLDTFLPFRLSVLSNAVSRGIAAIYAEEFKLSIWQWRILAVLGEQSDLTGTELAHRTQTDKPTVSRATNQLLSRGLIKRTQDQNDRRRAQIRLTAAGQKIYDAVAPRILAHEADILARLSRDEVESLHALLTAVADATSPDMPLWQDSTT